MILSYLRRCVEDYDMIHAGDRIAIGVSRFDIFLFAKGGSAYAPDLVPHAPVCGGL